MIQHLYRDINATVADRWQNHYTFDFLSKETGEVARSLGYAKSIAILSDREEGEL